MDTVAALPSGPIRVTPRQQLRGALSLAWFMYGCAIVAPLLLLWVRMAVGFTAGYPPAYVVFLLAVILCARWGGVGPGLVSTFLCASLIDWFLLPGLHSWSISGEGDIVRWAVFVMAGVLVSVLFERPYRIAREASASRRLRDVTLASICDAVITTDTTGTITFLNSEAERLTGWAKQEAIGRPASEIFNSIDVETRELAEDPVKLVARTGVAKRPDDHTILLSRNGMRIPIRTGAAPIKHPDGRLEGIVLVFRDDSESRMAAVELQRRVELQCLVANIVDKTPAVIYSYRLGPDGAMTFPYASPSIDEILGAPSKELLTDGRLALARVHPDDLPHVLATIEESARTMSAWQCEFRVDSKAHGEVWLDGRSVPERQADGGILWYGCLIDVTGRKRAEATIQEEELKLRSYIENAPTAIVVADDHGTIVESNLAATNMFGYPPEELHELNILDLHPPEQREQVLAGISSLHAVGRVDGEYPAIRKDGQEIWVLLRAVMLSRGYSLGFLQETTQGKRSERQLDEIQQRLQFAMDAGRLGVWSHDFRTGEVTLDERCKEMFGLVSTEDICFQKLVNLITPDTHDGFMKSMERHMLGEASDMAVEFRIKLPDGWSRWILCRGRASYSADGEPLCMGGIFMDVSEQKQAEAKIQQLQDQFRHAQKMEAVGRLAGGVAHDFNNLLMVIQGYTEMLQDSMPEGDKGKQYAQQVLTASARAAGLTRQLLTFSRKQVLRPVALNLNEVVEQTSKMMTRLLGEDIEVRLDIAPSLWTVNADPDQMSQILMNLAVNARDAMPEGGSLVVATKNVSVKQEGSAEHCWVSVGDYVALTVTDAGMGMSKEVQDHLFEPFFTTKEDGKGTGLGLATVLGVVQQSEGYVWANSELGRGTCITIYLPAIRDALSQTHHQDTNEQSPKGLETLLVVEDETSLHGTLVEFLAGRGYSVLAAKSPHEALLISSQYKAPIDVLITDVVMPGIRGTELSVQILRHHPGIKTIFMSGYIDDAMVRHEITMESATYLQKPFSLHSLAQKIREVIEQPGPDRRPGVSDVEVPGAA